MSAYYVDSSVLLRYLFSEENALDFPSTWDLISSDLLRVECFRALDRIHKLNQRTAEQILAARTCFYRMVSRINFIDVNRDTMERAAQSFELPIKTLDAIHLSTALLYREEFDKSLVVLTHDLQFSRAAQSMNFEVHG
jgi:predicted nucleic acid-binding protein